MVKNLKNLFVESWCFLVIVITVAKTTISQLQQEAFEFYFFKKELLLRKR